MFQLRAFTEMPKATLLYQYYIDNIIAIISLATRVTRHRDRISYRNHNRCHAVFTLGHVNDVK